jgi:hypothetical protein
VDKKIICTDSPNNLIAQQSLGTKKNPELKDLMAEEGNNIKLMWVPAHTGIKRNEEADEAANEFLLQEEKCLKIDKGPGWFFKIQFSRLYPKNVRFYSKLKKIWINLIKEVFFILELI